MEHDEQGGRREHGSTHHGADRSRALERGHDDARLGHNEPDEHDACGHSEDAFQPAEASDELTQRLEPSPRPGAVHPLIVGGYPVRPYREARTGREGRRAGSPFSVERELGPAARGDHPDHPGRDGQVRDIEHDPRRRQEVVDGA